jgi:hypothetical protein
MKIMKTLVCLEGTSRIIRVDTIEHEGKLWLVPKWLVSPVEGVQRPERIVRMDLLQRQKTTLRKDGKSADYLLNIPMPESVLLGLFQHGKDSKYEVVPTPDIQIPLVDRRKN